MNFFYKDGESSYIIDKKILDLIRDMDPKVTESGYYKYMVNWYPDISFFNRYLNKDGFDVDDLWKSMQFLSMTADFTDEIIDKYNLSEKKYLINLLRILYLEVDGNTISMGYKRPFGNSGVERDVRDELVHCGVKAQLTEDDYENGYDYAFEEEVLKEFSEFVVDFFKGGFKVRWYSFVNDNTKPRWGSNDSFIANLNYWKNLGFDRTHSYLGDWRQSKSENREMRINDILN